MDQIDQLQAMIRAFQERQGRTPADWSELRAVGYLKGTPVDPTGTPYLLEAGVVVMDRKSPLAPLPTTPR